MNKFFTVLVAAAVFLFGFAACDSIPFVAQNNPTETPTRRAPRPTFTPKAKATATQEVQPTAQPTETDMPAEPTQEPTAVPATVPPTKRPPAPPKATTPPQPTVPPAPKFSIKFQGNYLCDQEGVYKVILNSKNGKSFAAGQVFAIFDQAGNLQTDGAGKKLIGVTQGDFNLSIGSNCRVESDAVHPNSSNGELDVSDIVRRGVNPIVLRFVKSTEDMTPLSENLLINFGKGGQYWVYANTQ